MVNQIKFSEVKSRNHFNNTISTYIVSVCANYKNPKYNDDKQRKVDSYFDNLINELDTQLDDWTIFII